MLYLLPVLIVGVMFVAIVYWIGPGEKLELLRPRTANVIVFTILYIFMTLGRGSTEFILVSLLVDLLWLPLTIVNYLWQYPTAEIDARPFIIGYLLTLFYLYVLSSLFVWFGKNVPQSDRFKPA